jgi:hypothetical protein
VWLLAAALGLGACTSSDGTGEELDTPDAGEQASVCTGEPYQSCQDTVAWSDCNDGMECRFYMSRGFTICSPSCDATTPCPDDENGAAVACNMMGRCRSDAAASCSLP